MPNSTRAFYENYWQDAQAPPTNDRLREPRLQLLLPKLPPAARVLDVGCGDGRATSILRNQCPNTIGLDVSLGALRVARSRQPEGRWLCATLDDELPLAEESFDAIHCCEVIEHLLDVPAALQAMNRVLRPGGLLFLSTPYHGLVKSLAIVLFRFERHFDPTGSHIRFFTPRSLAKLLERAGFRTEKTHCLGRFWPVWKNLVVWARKLDNRILDREPRHSAERVLAG